MTIEQIKEKLNIKDVLAHYGYTINRNQHINCPFHDDKNPSMKVYEETNTVYCFSGNCSTHGHSLDSIEFVTKHEKCTKHEALKKCKSMINGNEITWAVPAERVEDKVWRYLKKSLQGNEKAKAYLQSRGLSSKGVGYHSGKLLKSSIESEAKEIGLLKDKKPWANQCIIYPLKNALDKVISFYGRSLTAGHFYLSGRSGLYPKYPSKSAKKIILTESIIDAASLLEIKALKDYEILALYGTNGLTAEHKGALQNLENLEEIILMLDGDAAGTKGSEKYEKELKKLLPMTKIRSIELPKNTDVNELWANHLNEELFVELLAEAKPNLLDTSNPNNLIYAGLHAKYYIKGLKTVKSLDSMKITLVISNKAGLKSRGKVELYEDTAIDKYTRHASQKLGIEQHLLDLDIGLLTDELEQYRDNKLDNQMGTTSQASISYLSPKAKQKAEVFLRKEKLFERLNKLIGKTGVVGEIHARLLLFVIATSYKCKRPLHALIQGSSGTGKTLLLHKIMDLIPKHKRHVWTRITDKALYHSGNELMHCATALEDWDGLTEEAQYAMREIQMTDELRTKTTIKQPNGEMKPGYLVARGPISSLMCTTHGSVYEDNMSRCFLTAIDESKEQTKRIVAYQNAKMRGEIDELAEQKATEELSNMVELLKPLEVVNPYAGKVQLPEGVHKLRRLNYLYLVFVQQVAWWHQYQRERDKKGRIIATKEDLQIACDLLFETIVLKVDELDGSLRQFFEALKLYLEKNEKEDFGQREIRQAFRLSQSGVHRYLSDLQKLDYIQQVGGNKYRGFRYKVSYWDDYKGLRSRIKESLNEQIIKISNPE